MTDDSNKINVYYKTDMKNDYFEPIKKSKTLHKIMKAYVKLSGTITIDGVEYNKHTIGEAPVSIDAVHNVMVALGDLTCAKGYNNPSGK